MKILAVSHYYATDNRGGGEIMLHEILKSFISDGHDVDAVATDNEGSLEVLDGVRVYKGKRFTDMVSPKYDLVITQFHNANKTLERALHFNIPSVYIVHNNLIITTNTLKNTKPSLVVFNSEWIKDFYNYDGESIVVHPPVYADAHATTRGDSITLVNLFPSKGVYAFYNLAARFPKEKFLGVKGGYYKDKQVVLSRKNVRIIENTQDMREVWSQTKILLMPSTYESYGMVGVEALASGIPVIASPTPGLKESLSYAGIFPKNNSIRAWCSEIEKLNNPEEYKKVSELSLRRSAEINPTIELKALIKKVRRII